MLLGAAATYVACAVPVDTRPVMMSSPGDHIAPAGTGGRSVVDAMTDPVPTAEAATVSTDIAVEDCKMVNGVSLAEHLYPGKSLADLAVVRAILHYPTPLAPGYENASAGALIRDGAAAMNCAGVIDRVTFILPVAQ